MNKKILLLLIVLIPFIVLAYPKGDVDGDGSVKTVDYILVRKHILKNPELTGESKKRADVNGDGTINTKDYIEIRKIILGVIKPTESPTSKPVPINYSCSGTITRTGTKITISPTTDVKEYEWVINNVSSKGTSTYSQYKIINNAKVNLTLSNNQKTTVNCLITDKLAYHFKYDESRPLMQCNTYTAADKIQLDAKLKQAVAEAGYGTRAGVVEAARFLVGALDYRIPYVGSSKYNQQGLNIGQKNAWGCPSVGLDCYYFVHWAISQNGLTRGALYAGKKYKLADEVNKLKVGDYLLTPCGAATCKNQYKINHIGIVIGLDNDNIYLAEAMTNRVNALAMTVIPKNTLKNRTSLSLVKHVDYPSEGNVTNMWLSE